MTEGVLSAVGSPYAHLVARMRGDEHGQALVEFALALPLVVFTLLGGADLARAYAVQLAVQNAARAGAEADVLGQTASDAEVKDRAREELARTPGVQPAAATISVTRVTSGTVTHVTVHVQYIYRTTVPWPAIPNTAAFDRAVTMRRFP